ncbi:MAG: hemophore-related protein, partial [Mycobacterium sp.]
MLISLTSARRLVASAAGASAVAGAMLFGATPAANAAPAHI